MHCLLFQSTGDCFLIIFIDYGTLGWSVSAYIYTHESCPTSETAYCVSHGKMFRSMLAILQISRRCCSLAGCYIKAVICSLIHRSNVLRERRFSSETISQEVNSKFQGWIWRVWFAGEFCDSSNLIFLTLRIYRPMEGCNPWKPQTKKQVKKWSTSEWWKRQL